MGASAVPRVEDSVRTDAQFGGDLFGADGEDEVVGVLVHLELEMHCLQKIVRIKLVVEDSLQSIDLHMVMMLYRRFHQNGWATSTLVKKFI